MEPLREHCPVSLGELSLTGPSTGIGALPLLPPRGSTDFGVEALAHKSLFFRLFSGTGHKCRPGHLFTILSDESRDHLLCRPQAQPVT
jgi:hypothetical protein